MRGRLTDKEQALIKRHLRFYKDLDTGNREPTTPEQRRFVKVCRGQAAPKSEHEIAYMKFRSSRLMDTKKSGRDRKATRPRTSLPHGANRHTHSVAPNPEPKRVVPERINVTALRRQIEAEQRAKEREEEKRREAVVKAKRRDRIGQLDDTRKVGPAQKESSADDIPEYEDGFPTPSWYLGRDNSSMGPYGGNRYKR